jgi:hypothetical protein
MKKKLTIITILFLTLLFSGTMVAEAQTQMRINADQRTEVQAEMKNIRCVDGVCTEVNANDRCDNGVCPEEIEQVQFDNAATSTGAPEALDPDSDGDGIDDGEEGGSDRANYNNTRSSRSGVIDPGNGDVDGDGYGDVREGIDDDCNDDTTCRNREVQARCGGDGVCIEAVQQANYNNSRSNRATVVGSEDLADDSPETKALKKGDRLSTAVDSDENICDGVTCPDGSCAEVVTACIPGNDLPASSNALHVWGQKHGSGTSSTQTWGRGMAVSAAARGDGDIEGSTSARVLSTLNLDGREVRGWSPESKESLRNFRRNIAATGTPDFAASSIAEIALDNEAIEKISISDENTNVRYRANLRLLGIIPMQREVEARAGSDGEVKIDYPWYRFLSSTPDSEMIRGIFSSIRDYNKGDGAGSSSL